MTSSKIEKIINELEKERIDFSGKSSYGLKSDLYFKQNRQDKNDPWYVKVKNCVVNYLTIP